MKIFDTVYLEKTYASQIGCFYALISHLLFVIGHFFVQKATKHLTPIQVLYFVGLQMASYNFITISYKNMPAHLPYSTNMRTTKMLLLRGFVGFLGACFILSGLSMTPLSEAIIIQMTIPVITGLLAICFLNEKYDLILFLITVFSFTGVTLVSKPEFIFGEAGALENYPYKAMGVILTLIGSFINASVQILIKKLGSVSDPYSTAYYFGFCIAISAPVIQIVQGINPVYPIDLFWAVLVGLCRYMSHILLNKSFALEEASKVSLMQYAQVPIAYVIDLFVVGAMIDIYSIVGSVFVFSCVFITLYKNYKKSHTAKLLVK